MYSAEQVAERIKALAKRRGMSLNVLLEKSGSNKNGLFSMANRGSMPKADNLASFADVLDCSIDYLLGRTDNPEMHKGLLLQDDEALLLDRYSRLDNDRKELLRAWALELVLNFDRGSGNMETKKPASDPADAGEVITG